MKAKQNCQVKIICGFTNINKKSAKSDGKEERRRITVRCFQHVENSNGKFCLKRGFRKYNFPFGLSLFSSLLFLPIIPCEFLTSFTLTFQDTTDGLGTIQDRRHSNFLFRQLLPLATYSHWEKEGLRSNRGSVSFSCQLFQVWKTLSTG